MFIFTIMLLILPIVLMIMLIMSMIFLCCVRFLCLCLCFVLFVRLCMIVYVCVYVFYVVARVCSIFVCVCTIVLCVCKVFLCFRDDVCTIFLLLLLYLSCLCLLPIWLWLVCKIVMFLYDKVIRQSHKRHNIIVQRPKNNIQAHSNIIQTHDIRSYTNHDCTIIHTQKVLQNTLENYKRIMTRNHTNT